jgi:GT2 family glycosyltransferase
MELAVIILNWNATDDTLRCIRHVTAWQTVQPTIWVVDNGSADDSVQTILNEFPEIHLVRNATNLGFAGGNNRAIVAALAVTNAPILLLNNDALIEEADVIRLLETLVADRRIGFIGPLLFDAEEKDRLLAAGGRNPVRHHHSHILQLAPGEPMRVVEYVPGTVLVGRSEPFRDFGLLDEDYFFSMEVADLCMRARKHGYLSAIDTRAHAFHAVDHRPSALRETLYTYYIIRNRFLFIRKFYPRLKFLFYAFWTLYSLALALKVRLDGKPAMARAIRLGLLDGLRGRFGGRNERVLAVSAAASGAE